MAVGDCVSGLHYSSGSAWIYLTPASGEEWVITRIGASHTSTFFSMEVAGSANYFYNMSGQLRENINAPATYIRYTGFLSQKLHWTLSPSVRLKCRSPGGGLFWWIGAQTKE